MKTVLIYCGFFLIAGFVTGCEKDNYDPPEVFINGRVTYEGQPLQLRNGENQLELWQEGYNPKSKIPVYINQEGSFSANVFAGTYKLVLLRGVGPWANNADTVTVTASGTHTVDVPVMPYFIIKNAAIKKTGDQVTATCTIEQAVAGAVAERLVLYLGATRIVDITNQVARAEKTDPAEGAHTISVQIPESLAVKGSFYARLGLKTAGVEQLIYTPVQKL